jgi:hypothetical protein
MSSSTFIRGLHYLEAFFLSCKDYETGFFSQLLVAAFYMGMFTYIAVVVLAMYYRNRKHSFAALGVFITDLAVNVTYYALPRVSQYQTTCDPHEYDTPSENAATCCFVMVYFLAYGAWTRDSEFYSVIWRMFLLLGNVAACSFGEMQLQVRNSREVVMGSVIGLVSGAGMAAVASIAAKHKHSWAVKCFDRAFCLEDTRVLVDQDILPCDSPLVETTKDGRSKQQMVVPTTATATTAQDAQQKRFESHLQNTVEQSQFRGRLYRV